MLELNGVSRRIGDRTILDGVCARVQAGERIALVGPTGSGKTSLLRAIAGLDPIDAGEIRWGEELLTRGPELCCPAHARGFSLVFQETVLLPFGDVEANVRLGVREAPETWRDRLRVLSELLDLDGLLPQPVEHLSGGEAQRVALARSLAIRPRLLLLDEPFSNLDRDYRAGLIPRLLRHLDAEGTTAVLVTHNGDEARAFSARQLRIQNGALIDPDARAEPPTDPRADAPAT